MNAGYEEVPDLLRWEDLSGLGEDRQQAALEELSGAAQASLDLGRGPLLRAVYFDLGPERAGRLLLVVHHLAVDGVSWRILLEDLEVAYRQAAQGKRPKLPAKTTSFLDWARALEELARSKAVREELPHWLGRSEEREARLPVDLDGGENGEWTAASVEVELGAEETEELLTEAGQAYRAGVEEVLLAALGQALCRWTGRGAVLVDVEGHGREEISERVDVSRTVGWFTTVHPVRLEVGGLGPGEAVRAVKEEARRTPRHGLGYGLLRYMRGGSAGDLLCAAGAAATSFNYLGQMDRGLGEAGDFAPAGEGRGPERSPRGRRSHLLDVTGAVLGGRLRLEWTYSRSVHRPETIEAVAGWFAEGLRDLLRHRGAPDAGAHLASDFEAFGWSQEDVDAILGDLEALPGTAGEEKRGGELAFEAPADPIEGG